jgi:hypothetical protein
MGEITKKVASVLPPWIKTNGEASDYLDYWLEGHPLDVCRELTREDRGTPHYENGYFRKEEIIEFCESHFVFMHARYAANAMVEAHRNGYSVYSKSPVASLCDEHIFTRWPSALFDKLDQEYKDVGRRLRGPGLAVDLPPLIALVLSRSSSRYGIPETILEIREEYAKDRAELWNILSAMWTSTRAAEQIKILDKLEMAAASIFRTAFPERFNALSIGWELGKLSPAGITGAIKAIVDHHTPRLQVSAVSFARRLADDLHFHLQNQSSVLRRLLSVAERQHFGV